jgi:hypothetical protein
MRKSLLTEAQIQTSIVDLLNACKYVVLVTSARVKTGNSFGIPDLLVRNPNWPYGLWLGMEVKTPGGKWTVGYTVDKRTGHRIAHHDQENLWKAGGTCRVESTEQAAYAVVMTDKACGVDPRRSLFNQAIGCLDFKDILCHAAI